MKAEWRDFNFKKSKHPEREQDYASCVELILPSGDRIAVIEQFNNNPQCFYANVEGARSGCLGSLDYARQWCETKTGNKVN